MNAILKKVTAASFLIAVMFVLTPPIQAYVLQGRHVLDLMIEKLGAAENLFVSEKLVSYRMAAAADTLDPAAAQDTLSPANAAGDDAAAAQPLQTAQEAPQMEETEFAGTLRYVFSRAFRSDAKSPKTERIHIEVGSRGLTIVDGHIVAGAANRFDLFKDVLLYRSRESLAERLLQLGVDVSISSLGRFEDKTAFVLGANYPDETANQLWVDKDTLLPLRLIIRGAFGAGNSDKAEMRYLTWWDIGGTQYPSIIEFYQEDTLVRVSQAQNFEENATFSEELFDIDHLEMMYPRAPLQPAAPEATEEPSEIQKAIDEFKRIFQ
jgi:hypothetical protein